MSSESEALAHSAVTVAAPGQPARQLQLHRFTDISEALLLTPLVQSWHAESIYRHLAFSERKFLAGLMATLGRKERGVIFYVVWRAKVVGVIELAVGEAWLSEGADYATCLGWFVEPKMRQSLLGGRIATLLFTQAGNWARENGAQGLLIHGTHGERQGLLKRGTVIGANMMVSV